MSAYDEAESAARWESGVGAKLSAEQMDDLEALVATKQKARTLRIVVRDTPAPQGSKRHVGHGRMVESSTKVKPWRESVRAAALADGPRSPLRGPLRCWVTFTLRKPVSAPKTKRTWPVKYPDADKLLRSTLDALGSAGVWLDDAQVIDVRGVKVYPGEGVDALDVPGAVIDVQEITEPWTPDEVGDAA